MMTSISGKYIIGAIGGNIIAGVHDVSVSEEGDNLDATTGVDQGYLRDSVGCGRLTINIKGYFDILLGTVTPVRRGTTVENLTIGLSPGAGGPTITVTEGLVQSCRITGQIRDRVTFEATIVSQGNSYTLP